MILLDNLRHIRLLRLSGFLISVLLLCVACSEDVSLSPQEDDNTIINVGAGIAGEIYSRESDEADQVKSGTYYLSYPTATDNTYSIGTVTFGADAVNPQIGFVSIPSGEQFKWAQVGGGSTPVFYLDNVAPELSTETDDPTIVVFDDTNPFRASLYDSITPRNDLLWGTTTVQRSTGTINFDLHHNMSRVRVQVTADNTYEVDGNLDLTGAKVEISNINLAPISYDRLTGLLTLSDSYPDAYGSITLVNDSPEDGNEAIEWYDSWENESGYPTFLSHSCILPPQELLDNENRPRLIITLKNQTRFSGVLPHAMEIDPPGTSESQNPYPVTLSFLKEHVLTIRTVISADPPELSFMPVKVVEWVDKGEFDLEAHQAGIYTAAEFFKMLEYYQKNNSYQLERYGWLSEDNIWNFNFFSTVILQVNDIDDLYGKMNPNKPGAFNYMFIYNNYSIYIRIGANTPQSVSTNQLYDILSGQSKAPFE